MENAPRLVVGESLVPMLNPEIFRRLGIEDEVREIGNREPGATVTFDAESEIESLLHRRAGRAPDLCV